ncbi:MAG: diguanylate cyclase [Candidatus Omnitrophica bacterium]|nr:diguanylate cyclase [Candidatus Omnitrophota bacterium]
MKNINLIDSRYALAAIIDSSFDAIIAMTVDNIVISWNHAAQRLLGYASAEMVGKSADCMIPEDGGAQRQIFDQVRAGKLIKHYQTVWQHKNGQLIPVSLALSPIKDALEHIVGVSAIARDITDRIKIEHALKDLNDQIALERNKIKQVLGIEEHLNSIFDLNKLIDFVVRQTIEVLDAEKCSVVLVDYDTRELCVKGHKGIESRFILGKKILQPDSVARIIAREGRPILVLDIEADSRFLRPKQDSYRTASFISAPIKLSGNVLGYINVADKKAEMGDVFSELDLKILSMIVRQVAVAMENARLYIDLKHLAITDPLTHIYNFRYFTRSLDQEIVRLKRYPSRPLCLFMIDVDDFKSYNDNFGHLDGDTLLQSISKVLKQCVREIDIVCRYAGDEFVVILPETTAQEAAVVAERIQKGVAAMTLKQKMTVSIGVAQCTNHNTNRYELIQSADMALLTAKKTGKNSIVDAIAR